MKLNLLSTILVLFLLFGLKADAQNHVLNPAFRNPLKFRTDIRTNERMNRTATTDEQLDSTYGWIYVASAWNFSGKSIYGYDGSDNMILNHVYNNWSGTTWGSEYVYSYTFDANNNETSYLYQLGGGGSPVENFTNDLYTYDANDNVLSHVTLSWNGTVWQNSTQSVYTYDANNLRITTTSQNWNGTSWDNTNFTTLTYDASNNVNTELVQSWNGSAWVNQYLDSFTYNGSSLTTIDLKLSWDGAAWTNFEQTFYVYDSHNNITSYIDQAWMGFWATMYQEAITLTYDAFDNVLIQEMMASGGPSSRRTMTYDANSNCTSLLVEHYNGTWTNATFNQYTFDANNYKLTDVLQSWNVSSGSWDINDSVYYYYHPVILDVQNQSQINTAIVYPNPAHSCLNVVLNENQKDGFLELTSSIGKVVYSGILSQQRNTISLDKLSPGIYFVSVKSEGRSIQQKLIIQ